MAWGSMKIAVTGSIGSGKSTVSRILASQLAARYLDTDVVCREELEPGADGYNQFLQQTGQHFLKNDGTLDRDTLRDAVFQDRGIKDLLESILHPLVQARVTTVYRDCLEEGHTLVVEVPLLYEIGWQNTFDDHVLVYIPEEEIFFRVARRSNLTRQAIAGILASQMPLTQKRKLANHVVDNSELIVSSVQQVGWIAKNINRCGKKALKVTSSDPKHLTAM